MTPDQVNLMLTLQSLTLGAVTALVFIKLIEIWID